MFCDLLTHHQRVFLWEFWWKKIPRVVKNDYDNVLKLLLSWCHKQSFFGWTSCMLARQFSRSCALPFSRRPSDSVRTKFFKNHDLAQHTRGIYKYIECCWWCNQILEFLNTWKLCKNCPLYLNMVFLFYVQYFQKKK